MDLSPDTLKFWHGGRRFEGHPDLRPSRKGHYECGPGFYLSNRLATARKYAKGGGQTVLVELAPDVGVLEQSCLPLDDQLDGLASLPRVRARKDIEQGLRQSALRMGGKPMPAEFLLNYCVNHEALGGDTGPALARWYASRGIDVSVHNPGTGQENWIVVFNPGKVVRARVVKAGPAWEVGDFPTLADQIRSLGLARRPLPARAPRP